jgi:DNA modification methylase
VQVRHIIEYVSIDKIVANPNNPRVHRRDQIRAIAHSMAVFSFNAPILVNANYRIIAGHGRFEAAKLNGETEVPIIRLQHLSEQQAQAYMLADNKLTDRSDWDDEKLALQLKELQAMALEFDIEATGFELPEIDLRIQSLDPPEAGDAAEEFSISDEGPVVSRLGDLWQLGTQRLVCGNALDTAVYDVLLAGERAGCLFTDPPYNVKIHGHAVGKGRKKHREFAMGAGEMTPSQFADFLLSFLQHSRSRLCETAVAFMCMDWRHLSEALHAVDQSGAQLINLCVWEKSNGGMGALYRSAHELVLVFRGNGVQSRNNVQLGRFGRNRTNVWHYPGMNSFARKGKSRLLDQHPTIKPVAMVADAILDVTKQDDIVLDPFCGSGTTIIAAERTGRRGYGIELDPGYVDLTISRWQRLTGESAVHSTGKTFAEVAAERGEGDADGE